MKPSNASSYCAIALLAASLLVVPGVYAQQPAQAADPAVAPVPSQITSAKRVFIANAAGNNDSRVAKYVGGPDGIYNQFYADVKSTARFDMVSSPAEADLVLEVTIALFPVAPSYPSFRLAVLDPKSNVLLWTIAEPVDPALLAKTARKHIAESLGRLADDLKNVSTGK